MFIKNNMITKKIIARLTHFSHPNFLFRHPSESWDPETIRLDSSPHWNDTKYISSIITITIIISSFLFAPFVLPKKTQALSLTELQKQAEQYKKDINQKTQATTQKKQDAALLNQALTQINSDINQTQSKINDAAQKITQTQSSISDLTLQIKNKEEELAYQKNIQAEALRTLYLYGDENVLELLFTQKSFSAVIEQNNYLESLETRIEQTIKTVGELKVGLEKQKTDLEAQKSSLELYKSQEESNKNELSSEKSQKNNLLSSTNTQIQSYLNDINALKKKVAEVQKQIDTLIATSSWGSDLVSSNDGSWYYSQLNYQDKLGASPYTVAQYGCLITSIAMVATYYGHKVTPADIAADTSLFDSQGYYYPKYPSYMGVHLESSGSVNWSTVNDDLTNGYPVIVSLYLPSVGALNKDGSSHFVVLKGFSNGKYLMHDPIGAGRSYSISQVRSMLRLREN
ncbi:MAG: C39 family peptidase [Patescibacteria group bacterium]